jgi:hypothetical protein
MVTMRRLTILFYVILFSISLGCSAHIAANSTGEKMKTVISLLSEVPTYPNSLQVGDLRTISKPDVALAGKGYKASVSYDDLKNFYVDRLGATNWQVVEERGFSDWGINKGGRELVFRQGEYAIAITYAGERASYAWDYAIDVKWQELTSSPSEVQL